MRYRRRPPEVEARQFIVNDWYNNGPEIAHWCRGKYIEQPKPSDPTDVAYRIETSFRGHRFIFRPGQFLIMSEGDWFILDEDDFCMMYEASPNA